MSTITLPNWMDFLDTACMWANDYPKAIMYSEIKGGANKVIDMWCSTLQALAAAKMDQPGVVQIGGQFRVVEVDESLLNRAKRTLMNVQHRPKQNWIWGGS